MEIFLNYYIVLVFTPGDIDLFYLYSFAVTTILIIINIYVLSN